MPIPGKNGFVAQNAVKRLRISKLRNSDPFMIYSRNLPSRHAYLEFPEGRITLVFLKAGEHDFTTLRELSNEENRAIRGEFNLEQVCR